MKNGIIVFCLLLLIPIFAFSGWVRQTSGTARNLRGVCDVYSPGYRVLAVGDSGTILSSTDFGTTWTGQASPTTQTLYGVSEEGYWNGCASAVGGDSGGIILNTTNGGSVWSIRASPLPRMHAVSFADNLKGWAAGDAGSIWRTTDGGLTWSFQAAPLRVTWYGIWFADGLQGWVCGTNGAIMATTDGGATWRSQPSGTSDTLRGVSFYNRGVVVGDSGRILRTTNGGSTWSPVLSGVGEDLYGVYMRGYDAYAVGANGRILKGSWDGSTWAPDTSPTTQHLRGVHYFMIPDYAIFIWAVGDSGTILHKLIPSGGVSEEFRNGKGPWFVKPSPLNVSPNPFTGFASVPGHSSERFALYDISGRKVGIYKGDRIGEGLSPGVYFLRPSSQNANTLRIVKLR